MMSGLFNVKIEMFNVGKYFNKIKSSSEYLIFSYLYIYVHPMYFHPPLTQIIYIYIL